MPLNNKEDAFLQWMNDMEKLFIRFMSANEDTIEHFRIMNAEMKKIIINCREFKRLAYSKLPNDKTHNN